jgi:alpha-galactosidase
MLYSGYLLRIRYNCNTVLTSVAFLLAGSIAASGKDYVHPAMDANTLQLFQPDIADVESTARQNPEATSLLPTLSRDSKSSKSNQLMVDNSATKSDPAIYEPFPTLYKVNNPDGTKGLPAPKSPPMGWNAWNTFRCNVNEKLITEMADAIVKNGMRDAGYTHINLDDCWQGGRDSKGKLQTNANFPSGIKALAKAMHDKGLKLGIYTSAGHTTCAVMWDSLKESDGIGSVGHEAQDAQTFAEWDIDYVKNDFCGGPIDRQSFVKMRDALAMTGKSIFYSINADLGFNYPSNNKYSQPGYVTIPAGGLKLDIPSVAHSARVASDIGARFDLVKATLSKATAATGLATPGFWNDSDMLEVGNLPSAEENKTHFAMWAMLASPLLAGNDVRNQTEETLKILTNREIIAVNQDFLNIQAVNVREDSPDLQVWNKPLVASGARAVALLNLTGSSAEIKVSWSDLGLANKSSRIRDLMNHKDLGSFDTGYSTVVPSHGVVILKVEGTEIALPAGTNALSDLLSVYQINGSGLVEKDMSNGEDKSGDGAPLSINGAGFAKGLGVASPSQVIYRPDGKCSQLTVNVGVDDSFKAKTNADPSLEAKAAFEIWGDGNLLANSGTMTQAESARPLKADLTNVSTLRLIVKSAGDKKSLTYADWADPQIVCQ